MHRGHPTLGHVVSFLSVSFLLLASSALAQSRTWAPVQDGFTQQAQEVSTYAPDRVLIRLSPEAKRNVDVSLGRGADGLASTGSFQLDTKFRRHGGQRLQQAYRTPQRADLVDALGVDRWMILETDATSDPAVIVRDLAGDPDVEVASVDWRAFPAVAPNDPMYPSQWGHENTAQMLSYDWATYSHENGEPVGTVGFDANAPAAWDGSQGYGDPGVVIAILDSGVDVDHPDLNLVAGYDFGDNDSNPDDDSAAPGHGTACAGVAAAIANNNLGVAGIAGGSSVMPVKVADGNGSMYFSYIQNALYWAADQGADVISMSLGAAISSDPATDTALQYAYDSGAVILAATGNENASTISYPAVHDVVIGVGAASPCGDRKRSSSSRLEVNSGVNTDPNGYTCDGERWWGSNYGTTTPDDRGAVDVIAPTILPTTDIGGSAGYASGDYDMWFNGTSAATPYAAGVAALVLSANPGFTPAEVRDAITSTAQDIVNVESPAGWDRYSGYGMVDAAAAVGAGGPVAPVADFTADTTSGTAPLAVAFTDASSGSPTTWSWDFGDGNVSTVQNPSHTYDVAGTYTVSLTVTNSVGSDTATKVDYVTVTAPAPPVADFTGTPTSGAFPLDVQFTDTSSGSPTSWSWDFGDGGTSTAQNPAHSYAAIGTYTVSLTVTSPYGSDTVTKVDYVTVTDVPQVLTATALADVPVLGTVSGTYVATQVADGVVQGIAETLSDNHPRKVTSWAEHQWRFDVPAGDAVTLKARASRAGGDGESFVFAWSTDQATWNTAFTVSSASLTDYSVGLPTGTSGTVYVRVVDTDRSWDVAGLDAVNVDYLAFEVGGGTPTAPTADFAATPTSGSYPLAVQFTDASSGAPTSWSWDFGDGGTSTAQNPSYTYAAAGVYTVTLTATNDVGSDVATKTDFITVTEPGTGGDTAHVASIAVTRKSAGPNDSGQATVVIVDAGGAPVANATVTGLFTGPVGGTFSGLTGGDGSVFFETSKTRNASSEWCFEVTDVTHASFTYDAASNVVTKACESGNVFGAMASAPRTQSLSAAPNPFNPITEIRFAITKAGPVRLSVFDARGRQVATLVDETLSAGERRITWQPVTLSSGVYFARLQTAEGTQVQRLLLLK